MLVMRWSGREVTPCFRRLRPLPSVPSPESGTPTMPLHHQSDHILLPHLLVQLGMLLSLLAQELSSDACPRQASSFSLEGCPAPSSISLACPHTAWMGLKLPLPRSPALSFPSARDLNPSTKPGACLGPAPASWLSTQPLFSSLCPLPRLSSTPLAPSPPRCQPLFSWAVPH